MTQIENVEAFADNLENTMRYAGVLVGKRENNSDYPPFPPTIINGLRYTLNMQRSGQLESAAITTVVRLIWCMKDQKKETDALRRELESAKQKLSKLGSQPTNIPKDKDITVTTLSNALTITKGRANKLEKALAITQSENSNLREKINEQQNEIINIQKQNDILRHNLETANCKINALNNQLISIQHRGNSLPHQQTAMQMVKAGATPAKKPQATIESIRRLKQLGLSDDQIAKRLGISRSTIWRRRKEATTHP